MPWAKSPMPGVERRMLDRLGGEVARATTIVRFAPESYFSPHVHDGGEEFLVLEGVFQDELGDFPAGSYVRNPPTSKHRPASAPGCTIFVKLWQFDLADRTEVRLNTNDMAYVSDPKQTGVTVLPLHVDAFEEVRLEKWAPGTAVTLDAAGGLEALVIEGTFVEGTDSFAPQSWLRLPVGASATATAGPEGTKLWIKSGHLKHGVTAPAQ
ncbi:MAG: cupin domain-containing protein [Pseudomonadota bacterium]